MISSSSTVDQRPLYLAFKPTLQFLAHQPLHTLREALHDLSQISLTSREFSLTARSKMLFLASPTPTSWAQCAVGCAENLASLRRIRALVTGDEHSAGVESLPDEQSGGFGGLLQPASDPSRGTPPDASAVFKGVRVLLEQNTGDHKGSDKVRLVLFSVCGRDEGAGIRGGD